MDRGWRKEKGPSSIIEDGPARLFSPMLGASGLGRFRDLLDVVCGWALSPLDDLELDTIAFVEGPEAF